MNKKFSTLLTMGLLVAGSLTNSAWAEQLKNKFGLEIDNVVNGSTYFLVEKTGTVGYGNLALGMNWEDQDAEKVALSPLFVDYETGAAIDQDVYLWTVTETLAAGSDRYFVTFKNKKTGKYLRVKKDGSQIITDFKSDDAKDANSSNDWAWAGFKTFKNAKAAPSDTHLAAGYKANTDGNITNAAFAVSDAAPYAPVFGGRVSTQSNTHWTLYSVADDVVTSDDLNELYNSVGFNFEFATTSYNNTIANLLNEDEALTAIEVTNDIATATNFGFPKGIYFATSTPYGSYSECRNDAERLDYLLNCTFIAVSPSTNISTNTTKQNSGEGFQLTTVAGKDLNLMNAGLSTTQLAAISADQKPAGSTINVNNAVFTVKTNTVNADNKYALSLAHIFYNKKGAKVTDVQSEAKVYLDVASDASYSGTQGLVTLPGDAQKFIFKFVESNVADGTDFISADGKSIYNITVFDYKNEDYNLASLADAAINPNSTRDYDFYAVGDALADVNKPSYQWVVTKVLGNDVTFTNRASGDSFTTKLFEQGDGLYTLAAADRTLDFTFLDINTKGNVETASTKKFHLTYVKLTAAEAEEVSGLDVANGTQVTLAFARDNAPTSNKMYPVVKNNLLADYLTDEVAEAAQWQLVKDIYDPQYQTFTYAYLDQDEKVAYKTKGDTVTYYTYNLQLVVDGNPVAKYLYTQTSSKYAVGNLGSDFVIQENIDGSVAISNASLYTGQYLSVSSYDQLFNDIDNELNRTLQSKSFAATSNAADVKAYLVQDAPVVSLPATASYITLQSALGNYIAMNEENDGVVISNEPQTYCVYATDLKAVVPSFFISTGFNAENNARNFLFNPEDSVNYYVGAGQYDKVYQWSEGDKKVLFKNGILNESNDTLTTSIKGKVVEIAKKADNKGTKGGLDRFKCQIVLADDEEDLYLIRQLNASRYEETQYLGSVNEKMAWVNKTKAMKFFIADTTAPTANEAIAAEGVQVIGGQGVVTVQGAAGKVVTVANILGQTIANQVAASDNVTIAVPAGIVVVAVDGEATKVVVK